MRTDERSTDVDRLLGTLGVPELRYQSFLAASAGHKAEMGKADAELETRTAAAYTIARSFPLLAAAIPEIAHAVTVAEPPPAAPVQGNPLQYVPVEEPPAIPAATFQQDVTSLQRKPQPPALHAATSRLPLPAAPAGTTPIRAVFRVLRGEKASTQPETSNPGLRSLFQR